MSISCFLEETDPILPNSSIIFLKILISYSRFLLIAITKLSFHVFCKTLIPYSIPTFHFVLFGRYWSHIQAFEKMLDGSSGFVDPPVVSKHFNMIDFQEFAISKIILFSKCVGKFGYVLKSLVVSNLKIIGFGSHGDVRQVRKAWKWKVFGFPQHES